jgi:hypothetical protein
MTTRKEKKLLDRIEAEIEQIDAELSDTEFQDFDIADDDYGFILTRDGSIKALILPRDFAIAPDSVTKICKVLGIQNLDGLQPQYMH